MNDLREEYLSRESKRNIKKMMIVGVPIVIVVIIFFIFFIFSRPEPNCFDGEVNGLETGIDCGGDCIACGIKYATPLEFLEGDFLAVSDEFGNFFAKIKNSNSDYAAKFRYRIFSKNSKGEIREIADEVSFIYPLAVKYLVESKIKIPQEDEGIEVEFYEVEWFRSNDSPSDFFSISSARLNFLSNPQVLGYLKFNGNIINETIGDFSHIDIVILLYSKSGEIINVSKTVASDIKSGEVRSFQFVWTIPFPEIDNVDLNRIDIFPEVLVD